MSNETDNAESFNNKVEYINDLGDLQLLKSSPKPRIIFSLILWLLFVISIQMGSSERPSARLVSVPPNESLNVTIAKTVETAVIKLTLLGAFAAKPGDYFDNPPSNAYEFIKESVNMSGFSFLEVQFGLVASKNINSSWQERLVPDQALANSPLYKRLHYFVSEGTDEEHAQRQFSLSIHNLNRSLPLELFYEGQNIGTPLTTALCIIVLITFFIVVGLDFVERTYASIMACTSLVALSCSTASRINLRTIMAYIGAEYLIMVSGLMFVITITFETTLYDYLSILLYKRTRGKLWATVNVLLVLFFLGASAWGSTITVMLLTPCVIRISELLGVQPQPVLICCMAFANLGKVMMPIGSWPHLVQMNDFLSEHGMTPWLLTLHLLLPTLLLALQAYFQLRLCFHNVREIYFGLPQGTMRMRRIIASWQRVMKAMPNYSRDQQEAHALLAAKIQKLKEQLAIYNKRRRSEVRTFEDQLGELESRRMRKDELFCMAIVFLFLIVFMALKEVGIMNNLPLCWLAWLAALLLWLIIYFKQLNFETILNSLDWRTLIFLATQRVAMQLLCDNHVHEVIGTLAQSLALSYPTKKRLTVAIFAWTWIGGLAGILIENKSVLMVFLPMASSLALASDLPLLPLVLALTMGVSIGGAGTYLSTQANVICVGISERRGYRFRFMEYFQVMFPITLVNLVVTSLYLYIAYRVFEWY